MAMQTLKDLSREDLLKVVEMFAKNWLAHDGCWFLAAEERHGHEAAVALDTRAWERFTVTEAASIMETFDIPPGRGLDALRTALGLRLYAALNDQEFRQEEGTLIYTMKDCRVQSARRRKGLPLFACKPVGLVEYAGFARTIDPRIATRCRFAPPDESPDGYCCWEFKAAGANQLAK